MIDVRQLRYFVAVAEEGSFTAAARRLNISQPPLSMQIKTLENDLGVRLFDRAHHGIALTGAGDAFLEQVRLTLAQLDNAVESAQLAQSGQSGVLRLAFTGSVPLVPGFSRMIRSFRAERPLARLEICHMATGQQLQALQDRRIDIGILRPAPQFRPPSHLRLLPFWKDELRLVMPSDHPLARHKRRVAIADLAGLPLVLFPREFSCGLHDHVIQLFVRAGLVPQVAQEVREGATIMGLVGAGVGVSLLPDAYERVKVEGVHFGKLEAEAAQCPLLLAHRRDDAGELTIRLVKRALVLGSQVEKPAALGRAGRQ